MTKLRPSRRKKFEDLGTQLVSELLSGKFDGAFAHDACGGRKCTEGYFAWRLKGYKGPAPKNPSTVELTNAQSLHLLKYVSPLYPAIAMTAHVEGNVHLNITTDPTTGNVTDATFVSGQEVLGHSAIVAAKQWQFSPGTQSGSPLEIVLKYELCPSQ